MYETLRYLAASLALGAITYFGSEALFWSFKPDDLGWAALAMTIVAYALCSACVLSAAALTGASGGAALFLGAALLGYLVEGVVVGTIYDNFPVQLVWTPLAWHAVVTGGLLVGLPRLAVGWTIARQSLAMVAAGLVMGLWAFYWPLERPALPPAQVTLGYLMGCGVLAVLGHIVLDRLGTVPRPPRVVVWVMPVLAAALWIVQSIDDPRPVRIAFPVVVGLTLWAMARLGRRAPASFRPAATSARHLLLLVLPLTTALIAIGVVPLTGGFEVNLLGLFGLGSVGFFMWARYLWRATQARAANAADRSIAPS